MSLMERKNYDWIIMTLLYIHTTRNASQLSRTYRLLGAVGQFRTDRSPACALGAVTRCMAHNTQTVLGLGLYCRRLSVSKFAELAMTYQLLIIALTTCSDSMCCRRRSCHNSQVDAIQRKRTCSRAKITMSLCH